MAKKTMEIARAITSDYTGILDLQSRCLASNLTPEEREDGFLSAEFSLVHIADMASDLGIVVVRVAKRIVGYMCASRVEFIPRPPILDSMLPCLEGAVLHGKAITQASTFIYGPVCIDREYRGTGLLRRMFSTLKRELAGHFEFGVAFVAADNRRSLGAHVDGLGMTQVCLFEHGGNQYYAVAFAAR
jgi:hypothetical protein